MKSLNLDHLPIHERKQVVAIFLKHCNQYATKKIGKLEKDYQEAELEDKSELLASMQKWIGYHSFNEYALNEMFKSDKIDSFFSE